MGKKLVTANNNESAEKKLSERMMADAVEGLANTVSASEGFKAIGEGIRSLGKGISEGAKVIGKSGVAYAGFGATAAAVGVVAGAEALGQGARFIGKAVTKTGSFIYDKATAGISMAGTGLAAAGMAAKNIAVEGFNKGVETAESIKNGIVDTALAAKTGVTTTFDRIQNAFKSFGQKIKDSRAANYTRFHVNTEDGETLYKSPSVRKGSLMYKICAEKAMRARERYDDMVNEEDKQLRELQKKHERRERYAEQDRNFREHEDQYGNLLLEIYHTGNDDSLECCAARRAFVGQYMQDAVFANIEDTKFPEAGTKKEFEEWLESSNSDLAYNPKAVYTIGMNVAREFIAYQNAIDANSLEARSAAFRAETGDKVLLGYMNVQNMSNNRQPVYLRLYDESGSALTNGRPAKGQIVVGEIPDDTYTQVDPKFPVYDLSDGHSSMSKLAFTIDRLSNCVMDSDFVDNNKDMLPSLAAKYRQEIAQDMNPRAISASYEALVEEYAQRDANMKFDDVIMQAHETSHNVVQEVINNKVQTRDLLKKFGSTVAEAEFIEQKNLAAEDQQYE